MIDKKGRIEGDREIKKQKQRTWNALKKWAKSKEEIDKIALREERKKLKEVRKEKKEEREKRKWVKIENSRSVAKFWEGVNGYRRKRKKVNGNIPKEEWFDHFKKLLGEEKENKEVEQRRRREGEEEGEKDDLNKDITIVEARRGLGRMKKGKMDMKQE